MNKKGMKSSRRWLAGVRRYKMDDKFVTLVVWTGDGAVQRSS